MKSIFIISGKSGSGKSTFLINILDLLQMYGFVVGGFVAMHDFKSDTYLIKNVKTNEESSLMQRIGSFEQRPNHFKFFPESVELGNNCIKDLLIQSPDIAIVDEIGGYELAGELWSKGFTKLMESPIPLIFTTKSKLLKPVLKNWSIKPDLIFQSDDFTNPVKAFERMKKFL